jgi:hypothetical protein
LYCDRCGNPLEPNYEHCPKCGKAIQGPVARLERSCLGPRLHLLGVLWIAAGGVWLIPSLALMAVGHAASFAAHDGHIFGRDFFLPHLFLPGLMFGILTMAAGGICVGWGLMHREPWARIAAIVLGILALFHPPFGTGLGIFTLWTLLSNDAGSEYEQLARTR